MTSVFFVSSQELLGTGLSSLGPETFASERVNYKITKRRIYLVTSSDSQLLPIV